MESLTLYEMLEIELCYLPWSTIFSKRISPVLLYFQAYQSLIMLAKDGYGLLYCAVLRCPSMPAFSERHLVVSMGIIQYMNYYRAQDDRVLGGNNGELQ